MKKEAREETQLFRASGVINPQVLGKSKNKQEFRLKEENPRMCVGAGRGGESAGDPGMQLECPGS